MSFLPNRTILKPFELATNLAGTTLNNGGVLSAGFTGLITLTSSSGFDSTGYINIESEILSYDSSGVGANQLNILARGQFGTTDVEHANSTNVGELYNSGILTLNSWTQVVTKIESDQNCNMFFIWYSDSIGTDEIRRLQPVYTSTNGYDFLSAPAFGPYVRYTIAPSTGITTTSIYFTTEFTVVSLNPQLFTLNSGVFGSMVSQLTRSVLVAQQLSGSSFSNIRSTDTDELLTNTLASNRGVNVFTTQTVGAATTWFMMIDLSDTTTWPHNQTGSIVLDNLSWSVSIGTNSDGSFDLGVVTEVDGTDGSVKYFYHEDWIGDSGGGAVPRAITGGSNFNPLGIDTRIVSGVPTLLLSSGGVTNDSALNTGLPLTGVASAAPGVGDIVMVITNDDASGVTVSIQAGYHSLE